MLTEVKNQFKISMLSVKYALMREMLNKVTFLTNIIFMVLNNASFIIQMAVLYSLNDNVGGYTFKQMLLLWGVSAGSYGVSRFFFKSAFNLSDTINNGKLDAFLVQPKNVLLSCITTSVETAAIGDIIYGFIMLFAFGFSIPAFMLFVFFIISGGIVLTCISVILSSLSFWFSRSDAIADTGNSIMTNFGTYPDGIFKGLVKMLLFSLIPVGIVSYIPVKVMTEFNIYLFLIVVLFTIMLIIFSFIIFYKGLKRYSSSNLMIARV